MHSPTALRRPIFQQRRFARPRRSDERDNRLGLQHSRRQIRKDLTVRSVPNQTDRADLSRLSCCSGSWMFKLHVIPPKNDAVASPDTCTGWPHSTRVMSVHDANTGRHLIATVVQTPVLTRPARQGTTGGLGSGYCGVSIVSGAYVHKIIRISLSAALVSARLSGSAEAAYQPKDFERIETLIEDGNWIALRGYIAENPQILDCNDQLAAELRRFLDDASGLYAALTFQDSMFPDLGLRGSVPDDCLIVADAPEAADSRDVGRTPNTDNTPAAPASSRAATRRESPASAPAAAPAAAASIY